VGIASRSGQQREMQGMECEMELDIVSCIDGATDPRRPEPEDLTMKLHFSLFMLALFLCVGARANDETPPGCPAGDCGIIESGMGPYGATVIGYPLRVLNDDEMRALYRWAKVRVWKDLPYSEDDYVTRYAVLLFPIEGTGKHVLVHLNKRLIILLHLGDPDNDPYGDTFSDIDLVRYTPRRKTIVYSQDGRTAILENECHPGILAGCHEKICRARHASCAEQYPKGVFRFSDGKALDPETGKPLANGIDDPVSLCQATLIKALERTDRIKQVYKILDRNLHWGFGRNIVPFRQAKIEDVDAAFSKLNPDDIPILVNLIGTGRAKSTGMHSLINCLFEWKFGVQALPCLEAGIDFYRRKDIWAIRHAKESLLYVPPPNPSSTK
jgi:hypothetical protein